jgi:hypothetical protein
LEEEWGTLPKKRGGKKKLPTPPESPDDDEEGDTSDDDKDDQVSRYLTSGQYQPCVLLQRLSRPNLEVN